MFSFCSKLENIIGSQEVDEHVSHIDDQHEAKRYNANPCKKSTFVGFAFYLIIKHLTTSNELF